MPRNIRSQKLASLDVRGAIERNSSIEKKRVTFIIPPALDQRLELYCVGTGRLKNEVAATALSDFLQKNQKEILQMLQAATAAATGR